MKRSSTTMRSIEHKGIFHVLHASRGKAKRASYNKPCWNPIDGWRPWSFNLNQDQVDPRSTMWTEVLSWSSWFPSRRLATLIFQSTSLATARTFGSWSQVWGHCHKTKDSVSMCLASRRRDWAGRCGKLCWCWRSAWQVHDALTKPLVRKNLLELMTAGVVSFQTRRTIQWHLASCRHCRSTPSMTSSRPVRRFWRMWRRTLTTFVSVMRAFFGFATSPARWQKRATRDLWWKQNLKMKVIQWTTMIRLFWWRWTRMIWRSTIAPSGSEFGSWRSRTTSSRWQWRSKKTRQMASNRSMKRRWPNRKVGKIPRLGGIQARPGRQQDGPRHLYALRLDETFEQKQQFLSDRKKYYMKGTRPCSRSMTDKLMEDFETQKSVVASSARYIAFLQSKEKEKEERDKRQRDIQALFQQPVGEEMDDLKQLLKAECYCDRLQELKDQCGREIMSLRQQLANTKAPPRVFMMRSGKCYREATCNHLKHGAEDRPCVELKRCKDCMG